MAGCGLSDGACSFSMSWSRFIFRYRCVPHLVPTMCRSLAAASFHLLIGLLTKSSVPAWIARSMSPISLSAVTIMIGMSAGFWSDLRRRSPDGVGRGNRGGFPEMVIRSFTEFALFDKIAQLFLTFGRFFPIVFGTAYFGRDQWFGAYRRH